MPSVIKLIGGYGFGGLCVLVGICFERAGWHWLTIAYGLLAAAMPLVGWFSQMTISLLKSQWKSLLDQLIEQHLQSRNREGQQ